MLLGGGARVTGQYTSLTPCVFSDVEQPAPVTVTVDVAAPSLTCEKGNMGQRVAGYNYTCAAEVFDFSPEMYLSSPLLKQRTGWHMLLSLPPVL